MSFQAMTWAVEQELPAMQKIVLLMLANRTNHDTGFCYPSHERLAKECGMSKRSMIYQIEKIEGAGLITVIRSSDERGLKSLNKYQLNIPKNGSATDSLPSAVKSPGVVQLVHKGSATDAHKPVIQPKRTTTTPTENFENSGTKLNALHREVFEWACADKYWVRCTNSEEDFLRAYCSPKGGMRKQFEERNNVKQPTGGNNGTHRQPPKKLSPAERVRKAAGIGEFAVGAGGSEFDYLENRGG
jgi:hypothetical protein